MNLSPAIAALRKYIISFDRVTWNPKPRIYRAHNLWWVETAQYGNGYGDTLTIAYRAYLKRKHKVVRWALTPRISITTKMMAKP